MQMEKMHYTMHVNIKTRKLYNYYWIIIQTLK